MYTYYYKGHTLNAKDNLAKCVTNVPCDIKWYITYWTENFLQHGYVNLRE